MNNDKTDIIVTAMKNLARQLSMLPDSRANLPATIGDVGDILFDLAEKIDQAMAGGE